MDSYIAWDTLLWHKLHVHEVLNAHREAIKFLNKRPMGLIGNLSIRDSTVYTDLLSEGLMFATKAKKSCGPFHKNSYENTCV